MDALCFPLAIGANTQKMIDQIAKATKDELSDSDFSRAIIKTINQAAEAQNKTYEAFGQSIESYLDDIKDGIVDIKKEISESRQENKEDHQKQNEKLDSIKAGVAILPNQIEEIMRKVLQEELSKTQDPKLCYNEKENIASYDNQPLEIDIDDKDVVIDGDICNPWHRSTAVEIIGTNYFTYVD